MKYNSRSEQSSQEQQNMSVRNDVIKTYSKRAPTVRYTSRAAFVPAYSNTEHVRESRLNDKTLFVDNFNDTFDRLTTRVATSSPNNSLDENGVVKKRVNESFDVFKLPMQTKRKAKLKENGKSKRRDLVSKSAAVKRKKVDVGSDDSGSSDQEETQKKKPVNSNNKKTKDKVKRAVKRKKDLPPDEPVVKDMVALSESADENVPNNKHESKSKKSKEIDDNLTEPKGDYERKQRRIVDFFRTSTSGVKRMQSNTDMKNISTAVMEDNKEVEKEVSNSSFSSSILPIELEKDPVISQNVPNVDTASHELNASEYNNKIVQDSHSNGLHATDNLEKPKELSKSHPLKPFSDSLTSTPRVNKILLPVDIPHLSPIVLSKEKRVSGDTKEKTITVEVHDENGQSEIASSINDRVQVPPKQVEESVKSLIKLDENQQSSVEENVELVTQEKIFTSELSQQESLVSNFASENDNQRTNENTSSQPAVDDQDELLAPPGGVESNKNQLSNKILVVDAAMDESSRLSPLMFDDSEWIHLEKSDAASKNDKVEPIQINFSQSFTKNNEKNGKATADLEQVEPAVASDKNFDISDESFYPHDWTNDYDSTYGYNQHKKSNNNDKNNTVDTKGNKGENINLTEGSEKGNKASEENISKTNEVSNIDNAAIHSVENRELEKTEYTLCNTDTLMEGSKSKSDEQEVSLRTLSISIEVNHNSMNEDENDFMKSQVVIEEQQQTVHKDSALHIDEPDESIAKISSNEDLNGQSLSVPARPSKRRRTDTSEIMIFNREDDDQANSENVVEVFVENNQKNSLSENIDGENVDTESADNISQAKPIQIKEIVQLLPNKELRIILSRVNPEDYESPSLSRKKPVKRKRVSRKSKDTDDNAVSRKNKQEKATPDSRRVTRRSVTENKMQSLYVQYGCKEVIIFAQKLEDQGIDFQSRRKSREHNIVENNELESSLTDGGLSEFLSKLNPDPVRVTMRRKTQKRYDRPLTAIEEDQAGQSSEKGAGKRVVTWGNDKRVTYDEEDSEDGEDNDRISQPIFLKPGKSWARSLSIINHFHNGKNLDELAAGRESWRQSVQTVLNMQPEVSARSHSQHHEETRRESRFSLASSRRESKSIRKSSILANSRFSMRIIPGGKRSILTDDLMDSQRISYVSDRSRSSRKTSLKIRRDTLIETEDDLIRSAKDIILKRCKQSTYEPFHVCFPDSYIDNCRKIGEGVYGEVFLYQNGSEKSVIKIIPIEGDQLVNCEPQKKFHEILSEIIIAEELHKLRYDGEFHTKGFVEVNRIMCVIGKYPEKLINLWYAYDDQKQSENDCPSMFEEDQLYIILELAHGGEDLEAYTFQNASESYAIFLQTALTLAVAEKSLEFEHRDLHWGNLLISKTDDKHSTYKLGSGEISIPTKGVKVAVIDFTLSRMSYQGCKIFNDLAADPTLFEAQGEYQFDIYRMMRDNVKDDWQRFNPFTNVLWMDYTLEKMITAVRYKKKTTKIHKTAIENMKALRKEIMSYSSAFDFVTNCQKVQALLNE